ncbi:transient receptor potential cation channel subfamily V member 2-like [Crotalus adamanteus]|uniref:Transient receptor potential cation channel subfamily V member 2-like n=1 Tax=Crotalus adamanteus TaxID=8729 RepID=A0AAW1CFQ1_CROAD
MEKSRYFLETDDGLGEDLNAGATGASGKEPGSQPLDTPFQKEAPPSPRIRVNLNYLSGPQKPDDPDRFDRDRLFQAVVAGDPELLNGLSDYLRKTSSSLSDPKYRGAPKSCWALGGLGPGSPNALYRCS